MKGEIGQVILGGIVMILLLAWWHLYSIDKAFPEEMKYILFVVLGALGVSVVPGGSKLGTAIGAIANVLNQANKVEVKAELQPDAKDDKVDTLNGR